MTRHWVATVLGVSAAYFRVPHHGATCAAPADSLQHTKCRHAGCRRKACRCCWLGMRRGANTLPAADSSCLLRRAAARSSNSVVSLGVVLDHFLSQLGSLHRRYALQHR